MSNWVSSQADLVSAAEALTDRQRHILGELARGQRVDQIAAGLAISRVYTYATLREAKETLGATTTAGAVVASIVAGAVELPRPGDLVFPDVE